jgi:hypothetical protein
MHPKCSCGQNVQLSPTTSCVHVSCQEQDACRTAPAEAPQQRLRRRPHVPTLTICRLPINTCNGRGRLCAPHALPVRNPCTHFLSLATDVLPPTHLTCSILITWPVCARDAHLPAEASVSLTPGPLHLHVLVCPVLTCPAVKAILDWFNSEL